MKFLMDKGGAKNTLENCIKVATAPFGTFRDREGKFADIVLKMMSVWYDKGWGRNPEYGVKIGSLVGELVSLFWDLNDDRVTDCNSEPMVPEIKVWPGRLEIVTPSSSTAILIRWITGSGWWLSVDFGPDGSTVRRRVIEEKAKELGVEITLEE